MYCQFFGLSDDPFKAAADPRYRYDGGGFAVARGSFVQALQSGVRVAVLAAPPGLGKTALLNAVAEDLGAAGSGVAMSLCHGWRRAADLVAGLPASTEGRGGVLLLDEAQRLDDEELRAALRQAVARGIAVLVAGVPEVEARALAALPPNVPPERVVIRRLHSLTPTEVENFIDERLATAGCPRGDIFSVASVADIAERAGGVPRLINRLCSTSLFLAALAGEQRVEPTIVAEAAAGLDVSPALLDAAAPETVPIAPQPPAPEALEVPSPQLFDLERAAPPQRRRRLAAALAVLGAMVAMGGTLAVGVDAWQAAGGAGGPEDALDAAVPAATAATPPAAAVPPPDVPAGRATVPAPPKELAMAAPPPTGRAVLAAPPTLQTATPVPVDAAVARRAPPPPLVVPEPMRPDLADTAVAMLTPADDPAPTRRTPQPAEPAAPVLTRAEPAPVPATSRVLPRLATPPVPAAEKPPVPALGKPAARDPIVPFDLERIAAKLSLRPGVTGRTAVAATAESAPAVVPRRMRLSAAAHADLAQLRRELAAGADPDSRAADGTPGLVAAARDGDAGRAAALIAAGANPNLRDAAGRTALVAAAANGHVDLVELLLRTGANVNAQSHDGWTALMHAVRGGRWEIVDRIVRSGANPTLVNSDGHTAATLARLRR